VAEEDAHAIVLGVSRGVEVGAGVVADAAVAGRGAAVSRAGEEAVRRLAGGHAGPRPVTLAWRELPGACVAVAWRQRPALARAA
jgi:hypothetical protein